MNNKHLVINKLIKTIRTLRSEDGCPWDRKQTATTLRKYLKEEVEELIQAIDNQDSNNICEEIGDCLYVLIMMAEIYREQQTFNFDDCIRSIDEKLIRRHPHVFGNTTVENDDQLREQWENIKATEKKKNN